MRSADDEESFYDTVTFYGYSPEFEELEQGIAVPEYRVTIQMISPEEAQVTFKKV